MTKTTLPNTDDSLPPASLWDCPMAWVGSPLRPAACYAVEFPAAALFVRGEARLTLEETIGPGMTRETERGVPALIRLDRGTPLEVHLPGHDGQCWTYRRQGTGRRARWQLCVGPTFPAVEQREDIGLGVQRVVVQSVLPMAGSGRYVSFAVDDQGRSEDFSAARDPDRDD